jgi:hypothetical protein
VNEITIFIFGFDALATKALMRWSIFAASSLRPMERSALASPVNNCARQQHQAK